jgi:hypothetical protein
MQLTRLPDDITRFIAEFTTNNSRLQKQYDKPEVQLMAERIHRFDRIYKNRKAQIRLRFDNIQDAEWECTIRLGDNQMYLRYCCWLSEGYRRYMHSIHMSDKHMYAFFTYTGKFIRYDEATNCLQGYLIERIPVMRQQRK